MSADFDDFNDDWGSDPSAGQSGAATSSGATGRTNPIREIDSAADRRGRRWSLGIIGLHNSGKTSWLYSLLQGAETQSRTELGWRVVRRAKNAAKIVDKPFAGERQEGTPEGVFSRGCVLKVKRRIFGGIPGLSAIGSGHWLEVSEVAGETVKRLADGGLSASGEARGDVLTAMQGLDDYLNRAQMLICLVELDAGGNLAAPLDELKKVLTQGTRAGRSAVKRPVTILLTKADTLRSRPEQDQVRLPRAESKLAALLESSPNPELAAAIVGFNEGDATIGFSVSRLVMLAAARNNLEVQECIAIDFLQSVSHAAARELVNLKAVFGPQLRCFLCSPYGDDFRENQRAVKPSKDKLRPLNVWEPLEAQFEDRWRWESRRRLRRASLLALALLGPIWWFGFSDLGEIEARFKESVLIKNLESFDRAKDEQSAAVNHPIARLERSWFPSMRAEQGERWLDLRDQALDLLVAGELDRAAWNAKSAEFESKANLEFGIPDLTYIRAGARDWVALIDASSPRHRETIRHFILDGSPPDLGSVNVNSGDSMALAVSFQRWSADSVKIESLPGIRERIEELRTAMNAGQSSVVRIDKSATLDRALERMLAEIDSASGENFDREKGLMAGRLTEVRRQDDLAVEGMLDQMRDDLQDNLRRLKRPDFAALASRRGVAPLLEPRRQAWLDQTYETWWSEAPWKPGESRFSKDGEERIGDLPELIRAALEECGLIEQEIASLRDLPLGPDSVSDRSAFVDELGRLRRVQELTDAILNEEITALSLRRLEELFQQGGSLGALDPIRRAQWRLAIGALQAYHARGATTENLELAEMDLLERIVQTVGVLDESNPVPEMDRRILAFRRCLAKERFDQKLYERELDQILEFVADDRAVAEAVGRAILSSPHRILATSVLLEEGRNCQSTKPLADVLWPAFCEGDTKILSDLENAELATMLLEVSECWDVEAEPLADLLIEAAVAEALESNANQSLNRHADRINGFIAALKALPGQEHVDELDLLEPMLDQEREFLIAGLKPGTGLGELDLEASQGYRLRQTLLNRGDALPRLHQLSESLESEWARVRAWDLVPARVGADEIIWIGRNEWTTEDLKRALAECDPVEQSRLEKKLKRNELMKGLSDTFLGVLDRSTAETIMENVGLRLPTDHEFSRLDRNVSPKREPSFDETASAQLIEIGDVSPDGVVGLRYGVREWVTGRAVPTGGSSLSAGQGEADLPAPKDSLDLGMRPALDFFAIPPRLGKETD